MKDQLSIIIHTGHNGVLPDLRTAWHECLRYAPEHQQLFTYEWYAAWLATYGTRHPWTGRNFVLVAQKPAGTVVSLFPLTVRHEKGLRILSLPGLYQPFRGFVCWRDTEEEATRLFVAALIKMQRQWDILRLGLLDVVLPECAALLRHVQAATGKTMLLPKGRTIFCDLTGSIEDFLARDSVKRIERYERHLTKHISTQIRHFHNPQGSEIDAMLAAFRDIENNCWLAKNGGDLRFATQTDTSFWKRLVSSAGNSGIQVDAWIAYLNKEPGAFRIALTTGRSSYAIANQYADHFDNYRLGWILYLQNLKYAYTCGTITIDLSPGDLQNYKERLGGREGAMQATVLACANTLTGWVSYLGLKAGLTLCRTATGNRIIGRFFKA